MIGSMLCHSFAYILIIYILILMTKTGFWIMNGNIDGSKFWRILSWFGFVLNILCGCGGLASQGSLDGS